MMNVCATRAYIVMLEVAAAVSVARRLGRMRYTELKCMRFEYIAA
jgi:hypothetical protein